MEVASNAPLTKVYIPPNILRSFFKNTDEGGYACIMSTDDCNQKFAGKYSASTAYKHAMSKKHLDQTMGILNSCTWSEQR